MLAYSSFQWEFVTSDLQQWFKFELAISVQLRLEASLTTTYIMLYMCTLYHFGYILPAKLEVPIHHRLMIIIKYLLLILVDMCLIQLLPIYIHSNHTTS